MFKRIDLANQSGLYLEQLVLVGVMEEWVTYQKIICLLQGP